jgi:hypothetical protein
MDPFLGQPDRQTARHSRHSCLSTSCLAAGHSQTQLRNKAPRRRLIFTSCLAARHSQTTLLNKALSPLAKTLQHLATPLNTQKPKKPKKRKIEKSKK